MAVNYTYNQYIDGVMSGEITACRWVKLAVKRHLNDLNTAHQRGLHFDEKAAERVIKFFSLLKHSKGKWAGQKIKLEPWQQFILAMVFGWKRSDGTRRFRTAYLEVARKNGKSTLAAGIGLYLMLADGEGGAEVYSAATKKDQAKIVFDEATRMVSSSPSLSKRLETYKEAITDLKTFSKFAPLGRDSKTLDGLNPHGAVIDELHAHPSGEMWGVLKTGMGAREQPLIFAITTAGFNQYGFCQEQRDYVTQILEGVHQNDSYFGIIYTLDGENKKDDKDKDDYFDEANWIKANPNLGVSVKLDTFREMALEAKAKPTERQEFITKNLNIWTNAQTSWVDWDKWKLCGGTINEDDLIGRSCWAGLDLSSTIDITALVLVFPAIDGTEHYDILCRFWMPSEGLQERSKNDQVNYWAWKEHGYIEATEGNVIDYNHILAEIKALNKKFKVEEVAYDRWGASKLQADLQDSGLTVVEFGQGYASMNPALKELERIYIAGLLNHGNNPILNWMASNVTVKTDPAGNIKFIKPDRLKSKVRIDGMISLAMATDRAVKNKPKTSVYASRGIRTL